jgi:hypothetical protein
MISLERELTYLVRTTQPLEPTHGSPAGSRQYWQVTEATLKGSRIDAKLAATGIDWMGVGDDGFWRPNVKAQFVTEDGAVIFLHYTGLVQQTDAFKKAAEENRETEWEQQYLRLAMRFDTGSARYAWLNQSLFVAAGRLLGTGKIEYAVFRVT